MLLSLETPEADKYLVFDCNGNIIPFVISFDTESEEIELMIPVKSPEKETTAIYQLLMQTRIAEDGALEHAPIAVKFKLAGAYAMKDGQVIKG